MEKFYTREEATREAEENKKVRKGAPKRPFVQMSQFW